MAAALAFGAIVLWMTTYRQASDAYRQAVAVSKGNPSVMESLGQFGDSFGSINALFTGLGFVGLAWTIRLQIQSNETARRSNEAQSRDQFIAARLHGTAALLESCTAEQGAEDHRLGPTAGRETQVYRQRLELLLCEARLARLGEPSIGLETCSCYLYAIDLLSKAMGKHYELCVSLYGGVELHDTGDNSLDYRDGVGSVLSEVTAQLSLLASQPFYYLMGTAAFSNRALDLIVDIDKEIESGSLSPKGVAKRLADTAGEFKKLLDKAFDGSGDIVST